MADLMFRKALAAEADEIADLINLCYRGKASRQGWTTEADLMGGLRTSAEEVRQLIHAQDSIMLLCLQNDTLLGSIHMERMQQVAHLGMFVVQPVLQGRGIGKQLLAQAEQLAITAWAVDGLVMQVISVRSELIAFYERRGYVPSTTLREFPRNDELWTPKVAGLQLRLLQKQLALHKA